MKLKDIESEIKAGKRALAMYNRASKNYPINQKNQDIFDMMQELERLEVLKTKKLEKKLKKLTNQLRYQY